MNILVTGGSGFFGKSLLAWWKEHPQNIKHVTILSRHPEVIRETFQLEELPFQVSLVSQDILEPLSLKAKIDYVIHAASPSRIRLGRENPELLKRIVIEGTRNVLAFSKQAGIKKLLFVSSGVAEVGFSGKLTVYGEAKLAAEKLCAEQYYSGGVEYVIARCFAFLGPYLPLDAHYAAGNFIRDGLAGGPIEVQGDGTPYRSYLFSDDLAQWLLTILQSGKIGEIYNVGSDEAVTIKALASRVSEAFANKPEIKIAEAAEANKNPERYIPDIQKAKESLGLEVKTPLAEALRKTIDFHQK